MDLLGIAQRAHILRLGVWEGCAWAAAPHVEDEDACIEEWLKMGMSLAAMEYLVACRPDLDDYLPRMRSRVTRSEKYRGFG